MLLLLLAGVAIAIWALIGQVRAGNDPVAVALLVGALVLAFLLVGLFVVHPNEGKVREPGLWWVNPFIVRKPISLRVRNFETQKLKVNDNHSNPIEIAAVVVWRVVDTAEAMFEVDDYVHYMQTQSEAALRSLAQSYPYDAHAAGEISLSTHTAEVSEGLLTALRDRL